MTVTHFQHRGGLLLDSASTVHLAGSYWRFRGTRTMTLLLGQLPQGLQILLVEAEGDLFGAGGVDVDVELFEVAGEVLDAARRRVLASIHLTAYAANSIL